MWQTTELFNFEAGFTYSNYWAVKCTVQLLIDAIVHTGKRFLPFEVQPSNVLAVAYDLVSNIIMF